MPGVQGTGRTIVFSALTHCRVRDWWSHGLQRRHTKHAHTVHKYMFNLSLPVPIIRTRMKTRKKSTLPRWRIMHKATFHLCCIIIGRLIDHCRESLRARENQMQYSFGFYAAARIGKSSHPASVWGHRTRACAVGRRTRCARSSPVWREPPELVNCRTSTF